VNGKFHYPFLTQKERDNETGLDYFLARYYSSPQGRFTGVDPLMGSGKPEVPQSLNRYSYCINNPLLFIDPDGLIWGYKRNKETGVTTYEWFEGTTLGEGFTEVTDFYIEGVIDGKSVSLSLNPNGPRPLWKQLFLNADVGVSLLLVDNSDYAVKGYEIGETRAQWAARSRTGAVDMMPNQAFDAGLFLGGLRGGGAGGSARAGLSMEGKAYELGLLKRHLPGTPEATKLAASRSSAHVFNDLSTLSRVESEIFARGTYTGSQNGFARFGLRFGEPIGTRIARDGTRTALDYGELKLRDNGLYHVIPRTGPRQ
jgi:RHS repeat-associated protein